MENKKITHWSIAVCEDANEDREMFEDDGEEYEVVGHGISVYGHKVEDNTVRAAASLTKQEIDSLNQVLGQDRQLIQNPILDISDKFRKAADEVYKKFKLPFGHKGYVFKNEGLGNIEFYTEVDVEPQNIKFYSLIEAHKIVKLLNFPLSSPLYLAAKLHEFAFEIEYYNNLEPTKFVQMRLLEIGIEAGRVERNLNDELSSHFDTMDTNKGKGRTAKALFDNGLSNNRSRRKGGLNRGNAIIKDSKVHHEIILKVFEEHGKEVRFKNKIKTGEFIIKHLPKHQERRDPRRVYEILEKFYTFDFKTKKWSKAVMQV